MATEPATPQPTDTERLEAARLAELRAFHVLDTPPDAALDELTQLAARWFQTPIALVSLIDGERQWFKSRVGMAVQETPRDIAFCDQAIRGREVMVVEDAQQDARFAANPLVTQQPHIRFYAGAPLWTTEGHALGTLCVIDSRPRQFSPQEREALRVLSHQVMAHLELRRHNAILGAALKDMAQQHQALQDLQQQVQLRETRLELVLKGANDGWWDWDLRTGERYNSERGWTMLGYTSGERPQAHLDWESLIHPDDQDRVAQDFKAAIRSTATHYAAEFRLRHRDGSYVPVLSRGHILRDEHGRAVRLSGTNTDLSERQRAERERQATQASFELLFNTSMDGLLETRPGGAVLSANPAACQMLGLSEAEILQRPREQILVMDDPRLQPLLDERERHGKARGVIAMYRGNGERFEVEVSSVYYADAGGEARASFMFRDISEREQWARRLKQSLDLLNNLARRVPGVIYQLQRHPDGHFSMPYASEGIWNMLEYTAEEMRENSLIRQRVHPDDLPMLQQSVMQSVEKLTPWQLEFRVVLPQQGLRWRRGEAMPEALPDGSIVWHGFISDITERKAAEEHTHRLAYFDALTGLPNRRMLTDRIGHALASAQRTGQFGALMFLDLDHFKHINDARGHSVGDALLQQVAQRLAELLRGEDTVARLGGDEFVVLISDLGTHAEQAAHGAMAVAEKVRAALDRPHEIEGSRYSTTGSIGLTLFPRHGTAVDDLLREADTAMYRAKAGGRNRTAFFQIEMQAEVEERLAIEQDLKDALQQQQFEAHAQSQVDGQGREVGAELLLRWHHPRRGLVSPMLFIPVAEASGMIVPLGQWVLRQACEALARLRASGSDHTLSVNVSPRQFHAEDFVAQVRQVLTETGAPADRLVFEVTEGLLIEHFDDTVARMAELVALGIRFSIDDFGTGYSSLAYLRRLPLYEIKIDKGFVQDVPHDAGNTGIVRAILSMASHLSLRVVAEGVETEAQARFLSASDCGGLQGYHFARPLPLAQWLRDRAVT
ncbi:bifunctional diguanylate cyclase/phosphodiesterase [Hydrogenophaga sp. OTU3427]|uniref:bifunctional diguanylate cyclase/phosphodiesterase n=1 Tax=Hydrogenophaga sp. OTU3427 TaxID=3043856 RepID=UPI00313C351E